MRFRACLTAVLALFCASLAHAQPASGLIEPDPPPIEASALPTTGAADQRIRGAVDGLFSALVTSGEFPGAVVLVIRNGEVTLKQGYGYADIEARTPVDPAKTRFRVGSISKLFTATAVMQLVEEGKLDLNADVNTYLTDFKIPATFPEPVTLSHLLTHTPGFDDVIQGLGAPMDASVEPLKVHLATHMPPRVLPPGRFLVYSNHGYALAGLIVEEVSGQPFDDYIKTRIFDQLRMTQSTFGIPDSPDVAKPYRRAGTSFATLDLDRLTIPPAGDLVTTAPDLAKFMIAHLRRGAGILSPETADFMQTQHFVQAQGLDGWAYGFAEGERNNVRWIGHGGSWPGFCADLVLVPEKQAGYFVAYNADCHFAASQPIRKTMFNALWRASEPKIVPPNTEDAVARAEAAAGRYIAARRVRNDFTLLAAAAGETTVVDKGEGKIEIRLPGAGPVLFLPRADGLWESPDLGSRATTLTNSAGAVTHLVVNATLLERVGGFDNWDGWMIAVSLALIVVFLAFWGWTNGFLSRILFGEPEPMIGFVPRLAGFVGATLTLVFLVAFIVIVVTNPDQMILHGPSTVITVLLALPVAIALCVLPMLVWSVRGFGDNDRARVAQAGYAIVTMAVIVVLAFAWHWNLHPFAGSL